MISRCIAIVVIMVLFSFPALGSDGGSESGNGGTGVRIGGHLQLLDFVEAGIEEHPYFDFAIAVDEEIKTRVSKALFGLIDPPIDLISRKLTEIKRSDPILATVFLKTIEIYSWRNVSVAPLPTQLEEPTLGFSPDQLVHLATRVLQAIQIFKDTWKELSPEGRAGLIFHEILYALMPLEGGYGGSCLVQRSLRVRLLTGQLFLRPFQKNSFDQVGGFPARPNLSDRMEFLEGATALSAQIKDEYVLMTPGSGLLTFTSSQTKNVCQFLKKRSESLKGAVLYSSGKEYGLRYYEGRNDSGCKNPRYSGVAFENYDFSNQSANIQLLKKKRFTETQGSLDDCLESLNAEL